VLFPSPSLVWLYVMFVASFRMVMVLAVPLVVVPVLSFSLNWKNQSPMRSADGVSEVKFLSQYVVLSWQLMHVVLVWFWHVGAWHSVGGLGVARSMKSDMFRSLSASPELATTDRFQLGVPHPAVVGVAVGVCSFLIGFMKNSPFSAVLVVSLL